MRVEASGLNGRPPRIDAEGYHAIVLQHEIDHLDGVMYVDPVDDMRTLASQSEGVLDYRSAGMAAAGKE